MRRNMITLIMAYYENPGMLETHYTLMRELPVEIRSQIGLIIVDDGSPKHPAQPGDTAGVPLQIYRMKKDVRWNQDACRNIGVNHSETPWCLLTDIDHIVPAVTWKRILAMELDQSIAYTFNRVSAPDHEPYKFHPNTWLINRVLYDRVGGYDERFAGYYGTDGDFRDRLRPVAREVKQLKEFVIRVPRAVIPDASTTTYLRKQPEDGKNIQRIKGERAALDDPSPLRLTFPYDRVHP